MRILLAAGEASGDAYAAALVEELRKTGGDFAFEGIGGTRLRKAIGSLIADSSAWGAIGIVHSLSVAPRAILGGRRAYKRIRNGPKGLFIGIDFGFFNIRVCRYAKRHGWKVLYFMPPSSYHRERQGRDLPSITDAVVTPFPWSEEILRNIGVNAHFFGHPLKQLIAQSGIKPVRGERIAVLPGSRTHEFTRNLPLIAGIMRGTGKPLDAVLEFAVAPNLDVNEITRRWNDVAPGRSDIFTQGDVYGVLGRCRAGIVCSGTATLEAALMGCPHVVVYQVTKAMAREAKLIGFKMPKFIALPNIVLDRSVVPEYVGLEIGAVAVRRDLDALIADGSAQVAAFEEISAMLEPADAITRTAELVVAEFGPSGAQV
jgi:lipid-A-disaccharide synthase